MASVILKVGLSAPSALAPVAAVVNTHYSIYLKESSNLQLIKGVSNDLKKLLKYFSGTAIFTHFFVPFASVLPISFALHLVTFALLVNSSRLKPHKLPE